MQMDLMQRYRQQRDAINAANKNASQSLTGA